MAYLLLSILAAAVRAGTPILFGTLGEIITERSGVLNLGVEGMMLMGALTGFMTAHYTGNPYLGIFLALGAGGLVSMIHAFLCITLRANQVVSGLSLTIFATGLSALLGKPIIGVTAQGLKPVVIPLLSQIPILGPILFRQDILVYFSYLLVPLLWILLYRTRPGLNIRSTGENPETADAMGVNVYAVRYRCVLIGGVLAGLGGAYLSLAYTPMWIENMTAGRGWIAIALVIFATWNPVRAVAGAYLFGGINALQMRIQAVGTRIPVYFLLMMPYLLTILVLTLASRETVRKRIGTPAALGVPYVREEKL